jgi:hypothetical protein
LFWAFFCIAVYELAADAAALAPPPDALVFVVVDEELCDVVEVLACAAGFFTFGGL